MNRTLWVCLAVGVVAFGSLLFPHATFAGVGVAPGSVNFGSITVKNTSSAATIVVTNTGRGSITIEKVSSSTSQFVVAGPALPLWLGGRRSVSFQVVFRPTAAGPLNGSIIVGVGKRASTAAIVPVSGTGIAAVTAPPTTYLLSPSAGSVAFGNLLVGNAASQGLVFSNTGTGSVTLSQLSVTGTGFSVSGFAGPTVIAPGQSLPVSLSFAPASIGSVSGALTIVSSATNSPSTIALTGTGVQPQLAVIPSSVSFGNVAVGVANSQTMTIQNPGTATLTITQASLAGTGYSLSGMALPVSLSPGAAAAFNVAFAPTAANSYPGTLTLVSNAPNSPLAIGLSGSGLAQALHLSASPTSMNFGSLTTGTSASQTLALTNTGNSAVSISKITASGTGFTIGANSLPISLVPGQSTSVSVAFAPASAGNAAGGVTIVSNAAESPLVVALSGSAAAPATHSVTLSWSPSSSGYEGFNIYRSTVSGGPYSRVDGFMIPTTSFTDSSVNSGQTYYYVATQVDTTGTESGYSGEVSAAIP